MLEPRRPQRFNFSAPLQIQWGSTVVSACVSDVSVNGLFIRTPDPFWLGAMFSADLLLDPSLQICCTVCRVDPGRGMGVRIAFANKEDSFRYGELVEKVMQDELSHDSNLPKEST